MPLVKTTQLGGDVFVVSKWSDGSEPQIMPIQGSRVLQGYNVEQTGEGRLVIDTSKVAGGSYRYSLYAPVEQLSEIQDGFLKENVVLRDAVKKASSDVTEIYSKAPQLFPSALTIRLDDKGFQLWKLSGLKDHCSLAFLNQSEAPLVEIDVDKLLGRFQAFLYLVDQVFIENPNLENKTFMPITPELVYVDNHDNFKLILLPNDNDLIDPRFEDNDIHERSNMTSHFCYVLNQDFSVARNPDYIEFYSPLQKIKYQLAMCYLAFRVGQNEPINKDTKLLDDYFVKRLSNNPPVRMVPANDRAAIDEAKQSPFLVMSILAEVLHNKDNQLVTFLQASKLTSSEIDVLMPYLIQEPLIRPKQSIPKTKKPFFSFNGTPHRDPDPAPDANSASSSMS